MRDENVIQQRVRRTEENVKGRKSYGLQDTMEHKDKRKKEDSRVK